MERVLVRPSGPLAGAVKLQGAKNSALKLMAATLLAAGTSELLNVPEIADVEIMCEVLEAIGASVDRRRGVLFVTTPQRCIPFAPYELVEKMRASIVVLGPLLSRHGAARVSLPGGDDFGHRPIDIHLRALTDLGVEFSTEHGYLEGRCDRLVGTRIVLEYPSHTATDNVLMAAVLAKGTTIIENAAREPEIQDLAELLSEMGAHIQGAGTSRIEIEGVEDLYPTRHETIPDRVEAATFLCAVAIAGGAIVVSDAVPGDMDMFLEKLARMGVEIDAGTREIPREAMVT